MSPAMKGLLQFISDLRNAKEKEEEDKRVQSELTHIQKQFQQQSNLSGYHRKKYIAKLLYIYLMGYEVNIGSNEVITLLQSNVYGEKAMGYLSLNLFISLNPSLQSQAIEAIQNDLKSENQEFISLALNSLANIALDESYVETFDELVFNFIRSPISSNLTKKKASLALLNLIKTDSMILVRNPYWIPRVIPLIDSEDYGLSLAVTSLIIHVAQLDYESCKPCISIAISKLYNIVIENNCSEDYFYHNVPAPWLTAKLFNLLEVLIPDNKSADLDPANLKLIQQVLQKSISSAISKRGTASAKAQNTNGFILFSSISLATHIDPSEEQSIRVADALISLLDVSDTNTRYLALGTLVKIAARDEATTLSLINDNIGKVFNFLKDRDVSIRHRSLDLIYITCNSQNVEERCSKLLQFLAIAEYALKPDIAVKIASLAENKATDANWFIITIMKLISIAGAHIGDEVWYRLLQIIVNNDSIQTKSCITVVNYLKTSGYPESMLKVGAFVLGEFGGMITDTVPPVQQFELLMEKYYQSSVSCRSMILSALLRFYYHHQELRLQIKDIYQQEVNSFSIEIQQRVLEYLQLISRDDNFTLLKITVAELPPFVTKTSPLIARLGNVEVVKQSFKLLTPQNTNSNGSQYLTPNATGTSSLTSSGKRQPPPAPPSRNSLYQNTTGSSSNRLSSASLSLSQPHTPSSPSLNKSRSGELDPFDNTSSKNDSVSTLSTSMSLLNANSSLSAGWESGYYRLIHFDQGIFYENSLFKIVYRLKREKAELHYQLTYINKMPSSLIGLTAEIKDPKAGSTSNYTPSYLINTLGQPESSVPENGKTFHIFDVLIREPFKDSEVPTLTINFMAGGMNTIRLKLPCVLLKGMQLAPLPPQVFFQRWNQIGATLGSEGETQKIVNLKKKLTNIMTLRRAMELMGFAMVEGADSNPNNIVCAGILNTKTGGFGCLLRLEVSPELTAIRVTLRSTQAGISDILVGTLGSFYVHGF